MRHILYISLCLALMACEEPKTETNPTESTDTIDKVEDVVVDKADLIVVEGNIFTEYYPGKKAIKFQGAQDDEARRHGRWLFFSEEGVELSMTMYEHGKKHGHSIVKYPNGKLRYTGEYANDKQIGIWKTYDTNGKLGEEKDYGDAEE